MIKRIIHFNPHLISVCVMSLMCICTAVLAQSGWEGKISTVNTTVWGYIKPAIQGGLFIWFAIKVLLIFIQRDKETNWWAMLLLIGGVVMMEYVSVIYNALTGFNPMGASSGTTP